METYIIAEAGVNHNGDMNTAKKLIDIAKNAGANAVKFQTFISEEVISTYAPKAEYQISNTGNDESQLEMVKKLELTFEDFRKLKAYCEGIEIEFLSTPFDLPSVDFLLKELQLKTIKIPSGEITNAPYLLKVAQYKPQIILSTGMSTLAEIQDALGVLAFGLLGLENPSIENFKIAYNTVEGQQLLKQHVSLLHCTTEYPAPVEEVNLNAMDTMKNAFLLPIGYSDHTEGNAVSIAAVAKGATIIEKHITYDKNAQGPDHRASSEPEEFTQLVTSIRAIESALGNGVKIPSTSEIKNIAIARKSIVAKTNIEVDETLTMENIAVKRPGTGISPMYYWEIQGFKTVKNFDKDEEIRLQ
ncbi:N-acetylneuraminate synthase [Lysinibacillus sp. 2017]|uniref:N-acetylneuraminate synthase n=1 Tax=unclassified Lysinibacillus TaxID=2636778 RepID=UPI000D526981|nr:MULTISPECIES: N-acetylneuraminate synthase [unclassified Lysinibacillus]AWE06395.1 N-acetylneuraminate synthase [Lysinibacillus sp. 2017]TGN33401.1 N-acetylneuraminate synthase [Lysinibacillus sp. S2017]